MTTTGNRAPRAPHRWRRPRRAVGAAAVAAVAGALLAGAVPAVASPAPASPALVSPALVSPAAAARAVTAADGGTPMCGRFDAQPVDGGRYLVQNNRWGTEAEQCVIARDGGFVLQRADGEAPRDGPPKSYPSIVAGCHWGRCSTAPGLPVRADQVGAARTGVTVQRSPGAWNVSYDLWFSSTPTADGQADDAELMLWLDRRGGVQPLGEPVGHLEAGGAGWTVWRGDAGWDVVTFVRDSRTSHAELALEPFVAEAVRSGALEPGSWLTSVQVGFEPWSAGAGLAVTSFWFEPDRG